MGHRCVDMTMLSWQTLCFEGFAAFVDQLNASLDIPRNLSELGVNSPDLEALTRAALTDPCVGGNPVAMTPENTRQLFEALI